MEWTCNDGSTRLQQNTGECDLAPDSADDRESEKLTGGRSGGMQLFGWFRAKENGKARAWREEWTRAIAAPDASALAHLQRVLEAKPPFSDDLELEHEMLDGLRQLVDLTVALDASRLPVIETTHRVVGHDVCHFNAPVSIPDDPTQPTGRLLLTSTRAAFAGSGRVPTLAWHSIREVLQVDRDVLFVRGDADSGVRFRCNSFADAVCGAALARYLVRQVRRPRNNC
jgi:hypothetical protein